MYYYICIVYNICIYYYICIGCKILHLNLLSPLNSSVVPPAIAQQWDTIFLNLDMISGKLLCLESVGLSFLQRHHKWNTSKIWITILVDIQRSRAYNAVERTAESYNLSFILRLILFEEPTVF